MTRSITCTGLFLCAWLPAQGFMTTPPGGLTAEGVWNVTGMGVWPDMRIQQADDMHSDGKAKAITEIAFRMDNFAHRPDTAMGRTWTNVTLEMSESTTYGSMSNSFARNVGASPARVFDSAWSWPTMIGTPPLKPDVWGSVGGRLRFPFTKPWVYSGKHAILADYVFRGGTLANNGDWSAKVAAYFLLDGRKFPDTQRSGTAKPVPSVIPLCKDSAVTFNRGAYSLGYSQVHLNLDYKLLVLQRAYYTSPGGTVIHVLGLGGSQTGVDIGAGCNKLHIDFSKPVALMSMVTLPPEGQSYRYWGTIWQRDYANMELWLQAAWSDSDSQKLMLTSASHMTLPPGLPHEWPRIKTLFQPDRTVPTGKGPFAGILFPHTRYKLQ